MRSLTLPTALACLALACGPVRPDPPPANQPHTLGEAPEPEPDDRASGPWVDCYAGISGGGNAEADLKSLTDSCGPKGGMRALTEPKRATQAARDVATRHGFDVAKPGLCFRVYAVGGSGVGELDVAILDPTGRAIATDDQAGARAVAPPNEPVCVHSEGLHEVEVSVREGAGDVAFQVWQR